MGIDEKILKGLPAVAAVLLFILLTPILLGIISAIAVYMILNPSNYWERLVAFSVAFGVFLSVVLGAKKVVSRLLD